MPIREVTATGLEAQNLVTQLAQRARLADPEAGLWEAADFQWWWRRPRQSDEIERPFWLDDEGPVAGVMLTSWSGDTWQCDPIVVPGVAAIEPEVVWGRAIEHAARYAPAGFDVPVGDDDVTFVELARRAGFTPGDQDNTAWMDAADRPAVKSPAAGFTIVDRAQRQDTPHPMRDRNGDAIAERLAQCSLYDPSLDLAVETDDGRQAGYSLYWFDPVTKVGLVEPVRVQDEFQRKGLATAMLTVGIDRLVARGAERIKISFETEAASAVYHGVGFRKTSSTTWYRAASG